MSTINDVKQKIYDKLSAIVAFPTTANAPLADLYQADIKRDPLDQDVQRYPVAFIMPPAIQTVDRLDNRTHICDLVFTVMVIEQQDNISTTSQIEDLMQKMLDTIDNSITFDNTAVGGVFPSSSFPEPFIHNGRHLVVFDIIIKARVTQDLTFA